MNNYFFYAIIQFQAIFSALSESFWIYFIDDSLAFH